MKDDFITRTKETRLYNIDKPIIGLTGGIATGKSTVTDFLKESGLHIICADSLVKEIYSELTTINFIKSNFPLAVNKNQINFKKLRSLAFSSPQNKEFIEDFIYERLPKLFIKYANSKSSDFIIYDVPLLFEKGLDKLIDISICVYAPRKTQIERVSKRDKTEESVTLKILENQMDIEKKKKLSDFVIENTSTLEQLKVNTFKVVESVMSK